MHDGTPGDNSFRDKFIASIIDLHEIQKRILSALLTLYLLLMSRFTRALCSTSNSVSKSHQVPLAWKRITPSTNVSPPPPGRPPLLQDLNPRSTAFKLALWMTVSTVSYFYIPWNDIFGFSGSVRTVVEDTLNAPPPTVDKTYSQNTIAPLIDAQSSAKGAETALSSAPTTEAHPV